MNDDQSSSIEGELGKSLSATLQHIELTYDRQIKLTSAREQAEMQVLHRVGSAYRCGEIGIVEIKKFHNAYSRLETPGRRTRWNAEIDMPYQTVGRMGLPNGPEGTWIGDWPRPEGDATPPLRLPVVYVLFAPTNEPCYVGSTGQFTTRLSVHARDKDFRHWQAYPCREREQAYLLEERLLRERLPFLNRKVGR